MHLQRSWLPLFALAWLVGLAVGEGSRGPALVALAAAVIVYALLWNARARTWGVLLVPFAVAAGASAGRSVTASVVPPGLARVEARVERVLHGVAPRVDLVLERGARIDDGDAPIPADLRVRVGAVRDAPPVGARVRALLRLRPHADFRNPSPHPDWPDTRPLDADAALVGAFEPLDDGGLVGVLEAARAGLRARLEGSLPRHAAGVARALLLGDSPAIDEPERDALRGAGLAHLLAVSGLHVALVAAVALLALDRALRGRVVDPARVAALSSIPLVLGFALMAGGAPSAWRAALMAIVAALLRAARRRPSPVDVASFAILLFAIVSPDDALRPAFLLSVGATAAIVSAPRLGELTTRPVLDITAPPERPSPLRDAFAVSVRSTVGTAPLVIWCFGELPLFGVVANVVLLPLGTLVLVPLAFAHALALALGLEALTAPLFTLALDGLVGAADAFAAVSPGRALPPPSVAQGWILAFGAALALALRQPKHILVACIAAALALGAAELHLRHISQPTGVLRITQVDVGQGDGAIVDLPDGSAMLVDVGGGRPDPGARALVPLLRARRRAELRVVILSHPHPDHYDGLRAVLDEVDAGRMSVGEVWDGGQAEAELPHGPAAALLRGIRRRGIPVRGTDEVCGARTIGGAKVEVLWPCPAFDAGYDANDNSFVLRLTHGRRRALFTGDAERFAEGELVASAHDLRADILKVPHHGSRTSSSEAFLRRVEPSVAIASQGRANRYGHPHADVVARYEALGIPLLLTSREGGVIVETDGETIQWWSHASPGRRTLVEGVP
ncbi:MAG: DNA internalization-related competence protein ComEC/Rec2 [Myxococcales bacterium]|nr:DNA internalization-related competence protein ComEC/Rec2 [Myxococcales bacterium]